MSPKKQKKNLVGTAGGAKAPPAPPRIRARIYRPQAPHMKPSPPRGGIADPLFLIALYIGRYNPGVCPLGSGNFGVQGTRYMRFFLLWPLYLCFEGILV